jgi:hypothetical protein
MRRKENSPSLEQTRGDERNNETPETEGFVVSRILASKCLGLKDKGGQGEPGVLLEAVDRQCH